MNMGKERLDIEKIKKITLDILIDVADFCERNNITYFLACGTLLGAIRHKGFIPWDNDIDIMIPRPDYKRFLDTYNGDYRLCKPESGMYYFAKVYDPNTVLYEKGMDYKKYDPLGLYIDIFPLDGIVNDEKEIERIMKKSLILETLLRLSNQPVFYRKNPVKAFNRIIPRIIGSRNLVKMIERNAQKYDYDESDYVIRVRNTINGFTGALEKEVYGKEYKEFEDHMFCVPKGYDKWLTRFYGDYMKLPPEEKRIIHEYECYSLDA